MQIGRIAGTVGTVVQGGMSIMDNKANGYTTGRAVLKTCLGYDSSATGETLFDRGIRALEECWWPIVLGEGAHQLARADGVMGSGVGLKINRALPKGINI